MKGGMMTMAHQIENISKLFSKLNGNSGFEKWNSRNEKNHLQVSAVVYLTEKKKSVNSKADR